MSSDFFKGFKTNGGFNLSSKSFMTDKRTVCVKTKDGIVREYPNITNPWRYIIKVKKNMNVENAWIKKE